MAELVSDCPRCGSQRITLDAIATHPVGELSYGWQNHYEAFAVCRSCRRSTIFVLSDKDPEKGEYIRKNAILNVNGALSNYVNIDGFVTVRDQNVTTPPKHLPKEIEDAFREGATCTAVGCFNAAGTMFRLCVDLATRPLLPKDPEVPPRKIRRDLGLRLPWLFEQGLLHSSLKGLSICIKEDGNDGAHHGTLTREDADDLLDFTFILLERLYTEDKMIELAQERREARRKPRT